MSPPTTHLHAIETFYGSFGAFGAEVGNDSPAMDALMELLEALGDYAWDGTISMQQIASSVFAVVFYPGFRVSLQRRTIRKRGAPIAAHLYLLNIERV